MRKVKRVIVQVVLEGKKFIEIEFDPQGTLEVDDNDSWQQQMTDVLRNMDIIQCES